MVAICGSSHRGWRPVPAGVGRQRARARRCRGSSASAASSSPPRGDKIECYTLVVPENRAQPEGPRGAAEGGGAQGQAAAARADPLIYLAGGPGDAPLVASSRRRRSAGRRRLVERHRRHPPPPRRHHREPARRRRLHAQPRLLRAAHHASRRKARRRAVTEQQERDILLRCRADFDKRKIDLVDVHARRRWPTTSPTSCKRHAARQGQPLRHLLRHALGRSR